MAIQRRKKMHNCDRHNRRMARTRARTKDLDQVFEDMKESNREKLLSQMEDPDLPGMGQFYCLECARYFIDGASVVAHRKSKVHKRRLKDLKVKPYTQAEADAGAGLTTDNSQRHNKIYKIHSHGGVKKRFRSVGSTDAFKRGRSGKGHLNTDKSRDRVRSLNKPVFTEGYQTKLIKRMLPYGN